LAAQDTDSDSLIGKVIQDRYRVVSRLGQGGMGVVYTVEHVKLRQHFALKVLDPLLARNADAVARFQREAWAAAAIGDEQIIKVTDMGELDNGAPYLVMELLEGRDLDKELEECEGPFPISRAIDLVDQCCHALGEAHKTGIMHRDIKPENIFLTKRRDGSDFIKILDFGVSKVLEAASSLTGHSLTSTGTAVGTPHYMSPEQASGSKQIGAPTDIYSLAVVLFQMLIGRVPFDAPNYPSLVLKIVSEPPPSLVELRLDVPPELQKVVHRALAKNPSERYSTMSELAEALAPFAKLSGAAQLTESGAAFAKTLKADTTPRAWDKLKGSHRSVSFAKKPLITGAIVTFVIVVLALLVFGILGQREKARKIAVLRPLPAIKLLAGPTTTPASRSLAPKPEEPANTDPSDIQKESAEALPTGLLGARQPKTKRSPVATTVRNPSTTRAEPAAPALPARKVTFYNKRRAAVQVVVRCGAESTKINLVARSQAASALPQHECQVTCAGLGAPLCPLVLRAQASSMEVQ
jgi:serine/threonine protein kinase